MFSCLSAPDRCISVQFWVGIGQMLECWKWQPEKTVYGIEGKDQSVSKEVFE